MCVVPSKDLHMITNLIAHVILIVNSHVIMGNVLILGRNVMELLSVTMEVMKTKISQIAVIETSTTPITPFRYVLA